MPPSLGADDTIIVKAEDDPNRWSRSSSTESMSPLAPIAPDDSHAAAVAQQNRQHLQDFYYHQQLLHSNPQPRRLLQSPDPESLDDDPDHPDKSSSSTTTTVFHHRRSDASQTFPPTTDPRDLRPPNPHKRPRTNVLTTEERLLAMPEKRPMPWRPGVDPGADVETGGDSRRKQIRFGCLLATRGDIVPHPCVSCANGRGKFSVCVANPSLFRGACAGCQLSGRPNRCSIKQGDDAAPSPHATSPEVGARNVKKKLGHTKSDSPLGVTPDPRWPEGRQFEERRADERRPEEIRPEERRLDERRPEERRIEERRPEERRPEERRPEERRPEERRPEERPIEERRPEAPVWPRLTPQWPQEGGSQARPPPNDTAPFRPPWATVNPLNPPHPTLPAPTAHRPPNGITLPPTTNFVSRSPMGWATVNQPRTAPPPTAPARPASNGADRNGAFTPRSIERERREGTGGNEDGAVPLIDSLPKNKQRQVYGALSGMQRGIEHLQREIDSFKRTMGIEDAD